MGSTTAGGAQLYETQDDCMLVCDSSARNALSSGIICDNPSFEQHLLEGSKETIHSQRSVDSSNDSTHHATAPVLFDLLQEGETPTHQQHVQELEREQVDKVAAEVHKPAHHAALRMVGGVRQITNADTAIDNGQTGEEENVREAIVEVADGWRYAHPPLSSVAAPRPCECVQHA